MIQPIIPLPAEIAKPHDRAFGILPNSVARDVRLGPAALVLLAYRTTFATTTAAFGLNATALRRQRIVRGKGLGRDVIEAALRQAQQVGYLQRQQSPRRSGRFGYAVDKLTLPSCSQVDQSGWIVRRAWFDGRLSLNALAAILYMRAGSGKGPIYKREVAERFGWSQSTSGSVLAELIRAGLIERRRDRAADGTITGVRYWLMPWDSASQSSIGSQGDGLPGHGAAGHPRTKPQNVLPMGENNTHSGERPPLSRQAPSLHGVMDYQDPDFAFCDPQLLGWAIQERHHICDELVHLSDEDMMTIVVVCDDAQLAASIKTATAGRVAPAILTPAGLAAVRALAALIHKLMNGVPADEALSIILEAIQKRIGDHPETRLSSLEVIGRRVVNAVDWAAPDIQLYESTPTKTRQRRTQGRRSGK